MESIDFDAVVSFRDNMTLTAANLAGVTDSGKWSLIDDNLVCIEYRSWYFGDRQCYRVFEDNDNLLFFTPNGALSYTATISNTNNSIGETSNIKNTTSSPDPKPAIHDLSPTTNSSGTAKDRFIRLAKNCPDCNFSGVDLSNAQLNHANLSGANLSGADLTNANLRQANLMGANLSHAKLIRTNLPGANLSSANLSHADFTGSNLIRANVTNATFNNTNLTGAHLESIQGKIQ